MVDPLHGSRPPQPGAAPGSTAPSTGPAFADVLAGRLGASKPGQPKPGQSKPVQFSGHALQRIERRGISIDDGAVNRLAGGVDRAAAKGSRSSLVLVDDTAFVVSVPNRTVVTAVDREHMREQVFTNIDSAVIA